ncbi:MAG: hypothetical protein MSS40_06710, partial [Bacteroidales bacterium]|nr:hypothetical protein [Bacteroidales bacterium]
AETAFCFSMSRFADNVCSFRDCRFVFEIMSIFAGCKQNKQSKNENHILQPQWYKGGGEEGLFGMA